MTISSGNLLPTDVHATLPLHIINFLSIDPPVSSPHITSTQLDSNLYKAKTLPNFSRPVRADLESSEASLVEEPMDDEGSSYSYDNIQDNKGLVDDGELDLGNLSLHDDTDEVVQYALASVRNDVDYAENAPRFADLYYSSLQENLDRAAELYTQDAVDNSVLHMTESDGIQGRSNGFASRVHEKTLMRQSKRYAGETDAEAVLSDELDTIYQVPHHSSFHTQTGPRMADPTCASCSHHVAAATAPSKSATPIPQPAESPCTHTHKQNPAVNASMVYDLCSTSISTASRSKSVKDKVRELEERMERVNTDV